MCVHVCVHECVFQSCGSHLLIPFPLHHLLRHSEQRKYLKIICVENWPFVFDILQIACHLGMAPNICENSTKKNVIFILIQPLPHKNSLKKDQSFSLMGTTLSLCLKPFKSQSTVLTDFQSLPQKDGKSRVYISPNSLPRPQVMWMMVLWLQAQT